MVSLCARTKFTTSRKLSGAKLSGAAATGSGVGSGVGSGAGSARSSGARAAWAPPPVAGGGAAAGTQTGAGGAGGTVDKQDASRALEWLARNSLRQNRLTAPPADNAHYYFSRLLELNPDNEVARQGFSAIAERFVVLAEEEFSRKNYDQAQAYITLGLQVEPDNRGLETLRSMIETRAKTFFDTLADYFKSG